MSLPTETLLDVIETFLADGLRRDAAEAKRPESTARVLLALGPDEAVPMSEVARRTARDPSTITRFVAKAAAEGLVERRAGVDDRRERHLALTPAGRAAREDLLVRRRGTTARLVRGVQARTALGPEEVDWFLAALHAALTEPPVRET